MVVRNRRWATIHEPQNPLIRMGVPTLKIGTRWDFPAPLFQKVVRSPLVPGLSAFQIRSPANCDYGTSQWRSNLESEKAENP